MLAIRYFLAVRVEPCWPRNLEPSVFILHRATQGLRNPYKETVHPPLENAPEIKEDVSGL